MGRLDNRIAVVTGGGRGIGRQVALTFAAEGASVVAADVLTEDPPPAADEDRLADGTIVPIQTDITQEEQVIRLMSRTIETFGRIDILVNNSGIAGPTAPVVDMKLDQWLDVLAVNLTGAMLCAKHALKQMIPRRNGTIVNIVSEGGRGGDGRSGYPLRSPYCCSKMGLIGLTETLSVEVGEFNIRVNAISPAAVAGDRLINVVKGRVEATGKSFHEIMDGLVENFSLGRLVEERDVAATALFLVSDEASGITGQTIAVNCGHHIIF